jgi:hypothetical protein
MWILPAYCVTQGLAYLDKTAINYANLFGIKDSLGITQAQFAWFASGFYLGYLVCAWPSNVLLQKFSVSRCRYVLRYFAEIPSLLRPEGSWVSSLSYGVSFAQ